MLLPLALFQPSAAAQSGSNRVLWRLLPDLPVVDVRKWATPDDGSDDLAGLQSAINATGANGGIVEFPPGVFDFTPSGTAGAGTKILAKKGVTLRGRGPSTRLKITSGAQFQRLFGDTSGAPADGFAIEDLVIDMNAANTAAVSVADGQNHEAIGFNYSSGVKLRRVRFENCNGINTVVANGPNCTGWVIDRCYGDFVPKTSPATYDNSWGYFEAEGARVLDSEFNTVIGSGARGCIELHRGGALAKGNYVRGFRQGFNVVGPYSVNAREEVGHIVSQNHIIDCVDGVMIWTGLHQVGVIASATASTAVLTGAETGALTGTPTTTTLPLAASASALFNFYTSAKVTITSGAASGQSGTVAGFDDTTKTVTLSPALSVAPAAGDTYSATTAALGSGNDNFYKNWSLDIVEGTGAGQRRLVSAYTSLTKTCTLAANWSVTPDTTSRFKLSHPMKGLTVTGNEIRVAQVSHAAGAYGVATGDTGACSGISYAYNNTISTDSVGAVVTENVVTFEDEGAGRNPSQPWINTGVACAPYGATAYGSIITANTVHGAPGPGMNLGVGGALKDSRVIDNILIDPGCNVGISNTAYRAAFIMSATMPGANNRIENNTVRDTGTSALRGVNLYWIGTATYNNVRFRNDVSTASSLAYGNVGLGNAGLAFGDRFNVREYGARGDGSTDDSAAINAAGTAASAVAGEVFIPAGTYVADNVTLYSNARYNGVFGSSILKLRASSPSGFLLRGNGAAGLMGGTSAGGIVNTVVENLILDGNKANNTAGVGIQLYGYGYTFRNLIVRNFDGHGIESDWNGAQGFGQDGPEAQYENVKIHDCDGQGLRFAGPHDTKFADCVFFRNNVNLYVGPNAVACQFKNFHSWSPTTQGVVVEGGFSQWANSAIEGAGGDRANFVMLGGGGTMAGVHFYGTDGAGSENATGLQLGQTGDTTYGSGLGAVTVTGAKQATGMTIQAAFDHCGGTGGALNFVNEANNTIRARFFQNQGTYTGGTPSNSTSLELDVNGLTADGTLALSGVNKIGLKSNQALVVTDKAGSDKFNVNTNASKVEVPNNAKLFLYSSGYSANTAIGLNGDGSQGIGWNNSAGTFDAFISRAAGGVVKSNGTFADSGVSNAGAIASSATIAVTSGGNAVGTIRCQPAGAVTGEILAVGSTNGQRVTVFNESAAANTITFAASGTSNVADGTGDVVAGLTSRTFVWNASTSLWYPAK